MTSNPLATTKSAVASQVSAFYERHPYPPPVDDLPGYRELWDDRRRRADSHLFWPSQPYRDDRSILVAGCGASQAAKYAIRWPNAKVTGIDVSSASLAFTQNLKRKYRLGNLRLRRMAVEQIAELGERFDHVVCTGVLHHMADPDTGLRALRGVLSPIGALHLMVYAPYGRAGVYLLQDYCRRLGIQPTATEIGDLIASLASLPPDHPLAPLLRGSPDFRDRAGVADALLHPKDRAYSVPQLLEFLQDGGLTFERWLRQAPYLPQCGALADSPHRPLLDRLPPAEQHAAVELFRGTMARHSLIARRSDQPVSRPDFASDAWLGYVPLRIPDTISVRERLPPGATAVLINRSHTYTDLYLPIDPAQDRWLALVDGRRTIGEIISEPAGSRLAARDFFQQLWRYDQAVFDQSKS